MTSRDNKKDTSDPQESSRRQLASAIDGGFESGRQELNEAAGRIRRLLASSGSGLLTPETDRILDQALAKNTMALADDLGKMRRAAGLIGSRRAPYPLQKTSGLTDKSG